MKGDRLSRGRAIAPPGQEGRFARLLMRQVLMPDYAVPVSRYCSLLFAAAGIHSSESQQVHDSEGPGNSAR